MTRCVELRSITLNIASAIVCLSVSAALAADMAKPLGLDRSATPEWVLRPAARPVSREYFGLHMSKLLQPHHSGKTSSWPDLDIGSWRLWGAYVVWRNIQPQPDEFHFDWLDTYVRMAAAKHVEVVLTLGMTPTWAAARPGCSGRWQAPAGLGGAVR